MRKIDRWTILLILGSIVFGIYAGRVKAEDKYKYGSNAVITPDAQYLKESIEQQKEIIALLKEIKKNSKQDEIIVLMKEIKDVLVHSYN